LPQQGRKLIEQSIGCMKQSSQLSSFRCRRLRFIDNRKRFSQRLIDAHECRVLKVRVVRVVQERGDSGLRSFDLLLHARYCIRGSAARREQVERESDDREQLKQAENDEENHSPITPAGKGPRLAAPSLRQISHFHSPISSASAAWRQDAPVGVIEGRVDQSEQARTERNVDTAPVEPKFRCTSSATSAGLSSPVKRSS
jgi:hypothetical protein